MSKSTNTGNNAADFIDQMAKNLEKAKLNYVDPDYKDTPDEKADVESPLVPPPANLGKPPMVPKITKQSDKSIKSTSYPAFPKSQLFDPKSGGSSTPDFALTHDSLSLASQTTGVVSTPILNRAKQVVVQSKSEIKDMAILACTIYAVALEDIYIEDLYSIANAEKCPLSDKEIRLYVRGIAKSNQVSMTTTLAKLVGGLDSVLSKNQRSMQSNVDHQKLLLEKMTLNSSKIDNISPSVCSAIANANNELKSMFLSELANIKNLSKIGTTEQSSSVVDSPTSSIENYPGERDIYEMFITMTVPVKHATVMSKKYLGFIGWDEYRLVSSGAVNKEQFQRMLTIWKARASAKQA